MSRLLVPLLVAFVLSPAVAQEAAPAGWGEAEREAIAEALHALNMRPQDLGYRKGPLDDDYRLPLIDRLLHDPLAIPAASDELLAPIRAGGAPSELLAKVVAQMQGAAKAGAESLPALKLPAFELPAEQASGLPEGMAPIVTALARGWLASQAERDAALAALDDAQREALAEHALALAVQQDAFGLELKVPDAPLWVALGKVRWRHLWRSGLTAQRAIEAAAAALAELPAAKGWRGSLRVDSGRGVLAIAGHGADRHDGAAAIVIDLGGDDLYAPAACGAWIADLAGDDVYRGGHGSLGCGVVDVRVVWDRAGDDSYRGGAATQGFGAFGIGMLVDEAGDDSYRSPLYAQGAGRTWGAGVLADRAGRDLYKVGGEVIHKPLLEREQATFGFGQGFSIGYRPGRSGGIALLWDGAGDDTYVGGTYTQGASYWFSLGLLADDGGNDRYTAFYYSQASAMHLCVAALLDGGGHDLYATHKGAVHAIGHDWGVALLWDKGAGDDVYAGPASASVGVANGVGIFVDSGGDDRYTGPPANGRPARGSGSVALFLDLGGRDKYGRGLADGGLALKRGRWSLARDVAPAPPSGAAPGPKPRKPHPRTQHGPVGSRPVGDEAALRELFDEASLWAVGSTRDRAWKARAALVEMGAPAARWMIEHKLATATSLQLEAFVNVLLEIGPEAVGPLLKPALAGEQPRGVANALYLVSRIKPAGVAEDVLRLLRDPKLARRSIAAAGALKLEAAAPLLVELAETPAFGPFADLIIAKALGQIGSPRAIPWLIGSFATGELPVREAAADALVAIGDPALKPLVASAGGEALIPARLALRALGALDRAESLPPLRAALASEDWGVRLTALVALSAMEAEGAKAAYEAAFAKEQDPRVKAALASLAPDHRWR